jgi:hypothetical protein
VLDDHGTPIIIQGLPKRPARNEDHPKERAERPRTIPRGSSSYFPPPAPSVPSPMLRQPTLAPYQPPPINSVGDRVTQCLHTLSAKCGPREQSHES